MLCPDMQDTYTLKPLDSRQFFQQRFGILEVSSVKAFGEPRVHRSQQVIGVLALSLPVPYVARLVAAELSLRIQQSLPRCNNRGAFQAHAGAPERGLV